MLLEFLKILEDANVCEDVDALSSLFLKSHPEINTKQFKDLLRCFLQIQQGFKPGAQISSGSELLKQFQQRPVAYLHIPKTGGTYIHQAETTCNPVISPVKILSHVCITESDDYFREINTIPFLQPFMRHQIQQALREQYRYFILPQEEASQYFMMASVRNPFSWFVSQIQHRIRTRAQRLFLGQGEDPLEKGFGYVLKTYAEASHKEQWPNGSLLYPQLFTDLGHFVPDWIIRCETLDEDLATFAALYNLSYAPSERQNVGHINDYRTYYTDDLIELVYETWGRELAVFGYTFDGLDLNQAIVKNYVSSELKERIRYSPESDQLYFGEVVLTRT